MLRSVVAHWLVLALVLAVVALLVPSVEVAGGFFALLAAAAVLGLVDALLGPLLRLAAKPLTLATLGLFSLVVNGVLLATAAALSDGLDVGGPLAVVLAALLVSVLNAVLGRVLLVRG